MLIKCKMCGGDLNFMQDQTVCECEFCGTRQTIPNIDNEKKANLFNRANRLRMNAEFDKAASVYAGITAEFPEEAEAYWGLCLCKYGIEYVDDPATGNKIPTCHRTLSESIMDDPDFDQACENADSIARKIYREEAKTIDRIQRDILNIVANEAPYDVFICYKETNDEGERTEDSVLAQEIYDSLITKGLKVFFARITLEDKLGQQYEPYIYAALHSAKVMLAIGTRFEYYDAVWVKNEWARFLDMMKTDRAKILIPCFKGIDAYDIPKEFKNLQAQDLGKLGWIQDLTRGIMKICGKSQYDQQSISPMDQPITSANPTIQSLLKRAKIFLDDKDKEHAIEYYNRVLDSEPQSVDAYIGILLAENYFTELDQISALPYDFSSDKNFLNAMKFADETNKKKLEGYLKIRQINVSIAGQLFWYYDCAKMSSLWKDNGESMNYIFEFIAAVFLAVEESDNKTTFEDVINKLYIINPSAFDRESPISKTRLLCMNELLGYSGITEAVDKDWGGWDLKLEEPILLTDVKFDKEKILGIPLPPTIKSVSLSHYTNAYLKMNPLDVLEWGRRTERLTNIPELSYLVSIIYYVFGVNVGKKELLDKVYSYIKKTIEQANSSMLLNKCYKLLTNMDDTTEASELASQCKEKIENIEAMMQMNEMLIKMESIDNEEELSKVEKQIKDFAVANGIDELSYANQINQKWAAIKEAERKKEEQQKEEIRLAKEEEERKRMEKNLEEQKQKQRSKLIEEQNKLEKLYAEKLKDIAALTGLFSRSKRLRAEAEANDLKIKIQELSNKINSI